MLVTGGAGFIGTSVAHHLLRAGVAVVNLEKLTYAGSNPPLGEFGAHDNDAPEIADVAAPTA
jgi:dTDP-glucose 4,6-dehydratase